MEVLCQLNLGVTTKTLHSAGTGAPRSQKTRCTQAIVEARIRCHGLLRRLASALLNITNKDMSHDETYKHENKAKCIQEKDRVKKARYSGESMTEAHSPHPTTDLPHTTAPPKIHGSLASSTHRNDGTDHSDRIHSTAPSCRGQVAKKRPVLPVQT